ncbi:MAG TPA: hypothetical protein ENG48_10010 [Candidatus Atribacteria bacterium]|nr:hypothetical protein [Candidatus Atribacteria bacterium]
MGVLSTYVCNKMLDHILKTGSYSQPTNIYVALFDGDPEGAGIECSGATYARVQANGWSNATSRALSNEAKIEFPEAGNDWGNVNYIALYDAITGGNLLGKDDIDEITVNEGDNLYIAIGDIDISIGAGGICNTYAEAFLDHIFKNDPLSVPTNLYVGYSTANIEDDASGLAGGEPSGNGYARKNFNTWNGAANKATDNNGAILFDAASGGAHGTITHFFIADHLSNQTESNIIFYGPLDSSVVIGDGDQLNFPDGDLDIEIDGA